MVRAVIAVNDEAKDPRACGVAAVAFMSDKMVDMKNVQGRLVQIVRISVVAAFDGRRVVAHSDHDAICADRPRRLFDLSFPAMLDGTTAAAA